MKQIPVAGKIQSYLILLTVRVTTLNCFWLKPWFFSGYKSEYILMFSLPFHVPANESSRDLVPSLFKTQIAVVISMELTE